MIPNLQKRFRSLSILIVGDVMLDEYISGSVSRISPEAPVPVLDVQGRRHVLGGAANVAANVASLGGNATLVGLAGSDSAGDILRGLLSRSGIRTDGLIDSGERCTICKTRIVAGQQQIVRIDHEVKTAVSAGLLQAAIDTAKNLLDSKDVVVLSDYAKGLLTDALCAAVIEEAKARGVPVIVDPKSRDFRRYRGCTVITPNLSEASHASGITIDSEETLDLAGAQLLRQLPGTNILITRGADGMTLFHGRDASITVPTVARQVYDVVGAGDTVIATLAACVGAGIPLPQAMRLANIAAGIVVGKPGTATTTVDEILSHENIAEAAVTV